MSEKRSLVELRFTDGRVITSTTSLELSERFLDPIDTMRATIIPSQDRRASANELLQKGEVVWVYVDGKAQSALMIQSVTRTVGTGGVIYGIDCVSPMQILAESTVDVPNATKVLSSDAPVLDFVASLVAPLGFTEVQDSGDVAFLKAKTGVNPKSTATAGNAARQKDCRAEYNETNLQFINRVLSRLGCMLRCFTSDAGVALYITAPHYDGEPLYTLSQAPQGQGAAGEDAFFGDVRVTDSNADQYSRCVVVGATTDEDAATRANEPKAEALTTDISASRPPFRSSFFFPHKEVFFKDEHAGNQARAKSVAKHVLGRRAERAFMVQGTVRGLVSSRGIPWTVDTLCRVRLPLLGIDEVMWISERTMRQDARGGQTTSLTLIPKGYVVLGDIGS